LARPTAFFNKPWRIVIAKDFIARVMHLLNESDWNENVQDVFLGSDTAKVETHIRESFKDAWRKALSLFPHSLFMPLSFGSAEFTYSTSTGIGSVTLPNDYFTLSSFKFNLWQKPAFDVAYEGSLLASIQANEYVRGNVCRPVLVYKSVASNDGGELTRSAIMLYYSLPKGLEKADISIETALYIPALESLPAEVDTDARHIPVDSKLTEPLAYLTAALVALIFEKPNLAVAFEAKAVETQL